MENKEIIEKFYNAFASGKAEEMVGYYHEDIEFEDPAFGPLKGDNAKNMWRMLIKNSKGNIKITYNNIQADDKSGSAHWEAVYVFSKTGRNVVNKVDATFEFRDGKIIKHTDRFDFWKWAGQALGLSGWLLGWTSFLKNKVRKNATDSLSKFISQAS